jgi:hypothetical protein
VVFVPVGQHQRLDVVQPVLDRSKVGQNEVHSGCIVLWEQHPTVDHQQPTGMLEDGHIATDLSDATEGDRAQATVG